MEDTGFVSSAADLAASDLGDAPDTDATAGVDAPDAVEPPPPDAAGVDFEALNNKDAPAEKKEPKTPDDETHEEEQEPETEPEPAAAEGEQLPDGVRKGKDRNGKDGLWLTPQRYEQFHGAHKTMREMEEIAGEPVTPQIFDAFARAFMGQEKLYGDLLSGDPAAQGKVLAHFLQESSGAMERGEVGQDPIVSLAGAFYGTLKENHQDGYARLRMDAANDLVEELYQEAIAKGNKSLWDSAGHTAIALGLPHRKSAEFEPSRVQATDPIANLQKKNQELEAKLNGRQATDQAAQFESWQADHAAKVSASLKTDAVLPALAEAQADWEKLPGGKEAFKDLIVDRLHSKVRETLIADKRFRERIDLLTQNARRATSAQRRNEEGEKIRQAYLNRAKLAVEAHRPEIEKFANRAFKEQNDATHERRKKAAQHVAAAGGGTPVKRSLVATKEDDGGEFATVASLRASMADLP